MKIKSFDDFGLGVFGTGPIKVQLCYIRCDGVVFGEPKGFRGPIGMGGERVYNRWIVVKKCESVSIFP